MRELLHAHLGRPAVVMGGGPSLPSQLESCPGRDAAVYISANDHGAKLVGADYIVALDKIEDRLRPFGVPIVSRRIWADYRLLGRIQADSGITAAWLARLLGCGPIYLAGMDLGGAYWHDASGTSGLGLTRADYMRRWGSMTRLYGAQYIAAGGPLAAADSSIESNPTPSVERLRWDLDVLGGQNVRFLEDTTYSDRQFSQGDAAELKPGEATTLRKQGKVAYI